jgi:protein SCO1/2
MTKSSPLSNNNIIFLLLIVIGALFTFQFIYHWQTKKTPPSIPPDVGLVFTVPRDIKPFELVSTDFKKFTQQNLYQHWTLLFFGFTHCSSICPTTLDMINRAYPELQKAYPNLQVVLISLDPERDSLDALSKYTRSFNPAFIGVSGKIQELRKLQSQFGIFSSRENVMQAKPGSETNYQIEHSSSILLIGPQGKWTGLFKYGTSPKQFSDAFMIAAKATS